MAENESFFKKVVRFVANPSTEWHDLSTRAEDNKEMELEKSELKAMIERKRRNDFVRKREFDLLRRVRREGLSPEQLASLGTSSRLDESEPRTVDASSKATGVKAKIDAIEQQMVGEPGFNSSSRSSSGSASAKQRTSAGSSRDSRSGVPASASTRPAVLNRDMQRPGGQTPPPVTLPLLDELTQRPPMPPLVERRAVPKLPPMAAPAAVTAQLSPGLSPLAPMTAVSFEGAKGEGPARAGRDAAVEVSEVVHDPELDEAVIAFANADFGACEEGLVRMTHRGGTRSQHAETWLVLFDLYRATGQQHSFESLAMEYAQQFGWSAPQWYSLPQMVAEAAVSEDARITSPMSSTPSSEVGWVCPTHLDIEAVARLRSQTLQMPMPWVLDWSALKAVDPEAAMQLSTLLRLWSGQMLEMRWNGGERLFAALQEAAPTGMRDADPVYWLTRLDALRLVNRPDQFDEAAIDYCITYEVSPPSWEASRCKVHVAEEGTSTRSPTLSMISEMSTNFVESALMEDASGSETARMELSGQLVGDIGATLEKMQAGLNKATTVQVSCLRLIRVDFIAAGDLLNWVLSRRQEGRAVHLMDMHRLVALFFGAMGINEHAKVQVRKL